MVQAMLADMDAATEAARQLLYTACEEIEAGTPDAARWAAICKLVAGDAAMRVTTDAVQVLGGYGYIDEYPVERMMRDAKITQLYEGTQQIQRLIVARSLLAGERSPGRQPAAPRSGAHVQILVLTKPVPDPGGRRRTARARPAARPGRRRPPSSTATTSTPSRPRSSWSRPTAARSSSSRWPRRTAPRRCARRSRWARSAASSSRTTPSRGPTCRRRSACLPRRPRTEESSTCCSAASTPRTGPAAW